PTLHGVRAQPPARVAGRLPVERLGRRFRRRDRGRVPAARTGAGDLHRRLDRPATGGRPSGSGGPARGGGRRVPTVGAGATGTATARGTDRSRTAPSGLGGDRATERQLRAGWPVASHHAVAAGSGTHPRRSDRTSRIGGGGGPVQPV